MARLHQKLLDVYGKVASEMIGEKNCRVAPSFFLVCVCVDSAVALTFSPGGFFPPHLSGEFSRLSLLQNKKEKKCKNEKKVWKKIGLHVR